MFAYLLCSSELGLEFFKFSFLTAFVMGTLFAVCLVFLGFAGCISLAL